MYEELVKRLRDNDHEIDCRGCERDCCYPDGISSGKCIIMEAADAIEELSMKLHGDEAAIAGMKREIERMVVACKPRWIPVTERLPERDQDVLVMVHWRDYPEDMMCYGRRFKTKWYLWNGELGELLKGFDITHWMPLPEPPKEET